MRYRLAICFVFPIIVLSHAQTMRVTLPVRTSLDDEGFHVTPFYDRPVEELKLPDVNVSNAVFFDIFYSRDIDNDMLISAMVIKTDEADLLYIDTNNDEDLTNDNAPHIFPLDENAFTFDISPETDLKQITKIRLLRKYTSSRELDQRIVDSLFFDDNGGLKPKVAMFYSDKAPGFTGKKGSFYIDERIALSRGEMTLQTITYQVGLFDWNNNGFFNDADGKEQDDIIIDLNQDGFLTYQDMNEVFNLGDTIEIGNACYQLSNIDPYGRFFDITKTNAPPSARFLKHEPGISAGAGGYTSFDLDPSFWDMELTELNGQKIKTRTLVNKFILLNFWGEWCKGCMMEIPELAAIHKIYGKDLVIISFLKTTRLEKARAVIRNQHMDWHHVILPGEIQKQFNIRGYPVNILISNDGKALFSKNQITRGDIGYFIK